MTDSQSYDLVVEADGKFYGVQVRTTYHKKPYGTYQVNLKVSGGNRSGTGKIAYFDPQSVDLLFIVTDSGEKYLIPSSEVKSRSSINLCDKYEQYRVE